MCIVDHLTPHIDFDLTILDDIYPIMTLFQAGVKNRIPGVNAK
jgi:hypothetical protein